MTIDNQKNGKRGQILSHHAVSNNTESGCPVRALVERTLDLLKDGASPETIICAYRESPTLAWRYVRSNDIVDAVKNALSATRTNTKGFKKSKVGSHSLRSGGAMSLFITGHDTFTIQRAGRWTSDTFMEYIHGQLDVTTRGLSDSMATSTPFLNMS